MFIGGCAGSTGGAMKCIRVLILIKSAYTELYRIFHPHGVITLKVGGRLIPRDVIDSILGFTVLYMLIFVVASLLLGLIGLDMITAFSSVASCIGNVGPGLGKVGPSENYNQIPQAGKLILSICMVIGRLEIYTVISLFIPEFWRK
jgi:trk system potassium uptake protein TrkH